MPHVPVKRDSFLVFLLKLVLIVTVVRCFIAAPFVIPSESMQPRLLIGDYLLVTRWNYGYTRYQLPFGLPLFEGKLFASLPERGDVVIFKAPEREELDYIKRVVALPGDRVELREGRVIVNDQLLDKRQIEDFLTPVTENMKEAAGAANSPFLCGHPQFEEIGRDNIYCRFPRYVETSLDGRDYAVIDLLDGQPGDNMAEIEIPPGHVFLLGDNRDRSADSRFMPPYGIGLVPVENIVGKAWITVFSVDGSAQLFQPWTWFGAVRWNRIGKGF